MTVIGEGFVAGRPRPKGSLKPQPVRNGRGEMKVTLHDTPESTAWLRTMVREIRKHCKITPLADGKKIVGFEPAPYAGPVVVGATFYFERTIGVDGLVWPSHDTLWPVADDIGDVDKLTRNLGDALEQSGLIANDRNVVRWESLKLWIPGGDLGAKLGGRAGVAWNVSAA